jgi:hypothetical protein
MSARFSAVVVARNEEALIPVAKGYRDDVAGLVRRSVR